MREKADGGERRKKRRKEGKKGRKKEEAKKEGKAKRGTDGWSASAGAVELMCDDQKVWVGVCCCLLEARPRHDVRRRRDLRVSIPERVWSWAVVAFQRTEISVPVSARPSFRFEPGRRQGHVTALWSSSGWQFLPFRKRAVGMGKPRKCAVVWTGSSGGVACTAPGVECRTLERGGKDLISGPETPPKKQSSNLKRLRRPQNLRGPPTPETRLVWMCCVLDCTQY